MSINTAKLRDLIDRELLQISDARVLEHIRGLLVEPRATLRDWDYGKPGEQHLCWEVLIDDPSNSTTGIVYCESGFGPQCPWGLVHVGGDWNWMGQDSAWFLTFMDAYFDSSAPTVLPIWRVVKSNSPGSPIPLTSEGNWNQKWKQVEEFRKADSSSNFYVHHTIPYGGEPT